MSAKFKIQIFETLVNKICETECFQDFLNFRSPSTFHLNEQSKQTLGDVFPSFMDSHPASSSPSSPSSPLSSNLGVIYRRRISPADCIKRSNSESSERKKSVSVQPKRGQKIFSVLLSLPRPPSLLIVAGVHSIGRLSSSYRAAHWTAPAYLRPYTFPFLLVHSLPPPPPRRDLGASSVAAAAAVAPRESSEEVGTVGLKYR